MQYLYQKGDGERLNIREDVYLLMLVKHNCVHVVNEKKVKVISMPGHKYARPTRPLSYGGGRLRNPYAQMGRSGK